MGTLNQRIQTIFVVAVIGALAIALGCDPADSLDNQDYRPLLENYQRWEVTDVVAAFNHLDSKRSEFSCTKELEAAQRAVWREKAGPIKAEDTPAGKALGKCLEAFHQSSGLTPGKLQGGVLSHWVSQNFVPEIQKQIEAEVAAGAKRLGAAGCGGPECDALVVIDDIAVTRAGLDVSVAWQDAASRCAAASFGGLSPWRLPTKQELVAMRESNKLATDQDPATYWSRTRTFDDEGNLQAYVLRFDLEVLGEDREPTAMPFLREGVPTRAKVRCVYDLTKSTPEPTEVDEMEKVVQAAGCPRRDWDRMGNRWWDFVRVRDGMMVTWKTLGKTGGALRRACRELNYCKLSWSTPNRTQEAKLAQDTWLGEGADERCVAELPDS